MSRRSWRKLLVVVLIVAVLAGLAAVGVHLFLARLPALAQRELERSLPFRAEIGEVRFRWPAKLRLRGVMLRRRTDASTAASIRQIEARLNLRELLGGRASVESLLVDGVELSLREGDRELFRGGSGAVPAYSIRVRGLRGACTRGVAAGGKAWLAVSGASVVLDPQAEGSLGVEAAGECVPLGRFRVSGVLGGNLLDSRVKLSLPAVPLSAEVHDVLPAYARSVWDEVGPSGRAAYEAEVLWPRGGKGEPEVTWRLGANGVRLAVRHLPEPLEPVDFVASGGGGEFRVDDATARYGSSLVNARCNGVPSGCSTELQVRGSVFDLVRASDVVALLPPDVRTAVEGLRAEPGVVDAEVDARLVLDAEGGEENRPRLDFVRVTLALRDCSMRPVWFPYQVERVTGTIIVGKDKLVIASPLVGWHGSGRVQATGTIDVRKGGTDSHVVVVGQNLPVDGELDRAVAALGGVVHKEWSACSLADGTMDVVVALRGLAIATGVARDWTVSVSPDGCSGAYRWFPYRLTALTGQVEIHPDRVSIRNLTGWHDGATVRIGGWRDLRHGHDEQNIEIRGSNVALDGALAAALSEGDRKVWDRFRPSGAADIDVLLATPTKNGQWSDVRVRALLKSCAARIPLGEKWLPVSDVAGRIENLGDVWGFSGVSARCLGGQVVLDGALIRTDRLTTVEGELTGDDLSVAGLVELLPEATAAQLRPLEPSGKADVRKLAFHLIDRAGQKPDLQYQWTVGLRDARVSIPLAGGEKEGEKAERVELSEITGRLNLDNERGHVTVGAFEFDKVRLLHGTMQNVVGRLRATGPVFALDDVRGELYGGHVEFSLKGAKDLLFFTARARADGIDVARLCRETGLTGERVWGDLRGTVHLSGERVLKEGEGPSWRLGGGGAVHVDRANLGRTPLVRSLLSYKTFLLWEGGEVEAASADFEIDSKYLNFDKLVLTGPALHTRGVGRIEHRRDMTLDLYFYRRAKGSLLPDLPVIDLVGKALSWMVDQIQNQLVVVHVSGPLRNPEISPVMFRDIGDQFKRFIIFNVREEEATEERDELRAGPRTPR